MPDRLASLLPRLALALGLAAALLPAGLGLLHLLAPRPDLRWSVIDRFRPPPVASDLRGEYGFGFSVLLANQGNAAVEDLRAILDVPPDHVDVLRGDGGGFTLSEAGEPWGDATALDLGSLAPDDRIFLVVYHGTWVEEVLADGEPVPETVRDPSDFGLGVRLPPWALGSAALLAAALGVLALGRRPIADRTPVRAARPSPG